MKKIGIGIFLIIGLVMGVLSQISTPILITAVLDGGSRPVKAASFFYLRHVRKLSGYYSAISPPLQFVVGGCNHRIDKEPYCDALLDWLLESGQDVNELDHSSKLGLSSLHLSVLSCDPKLVRYFLSHNCEVNIQATGEKFRGQTPLALLAKLKNCAESPEIKAELIKNGGHL